MNKVIEIIDSDDDSHTPTSSLNSSIINNMDPDDNQQFQSRRRRRKSVLHAMTDPYMQFQTITLDDDGDDVDINASNSTNITAVENIKTPPTNVAAARALLKTAKVTPKILAPKQPTSSDIIDASFEKFLNDPETINDIYDIAEERTRINYLLVMNGMTEMKFSLYKRPDRLQFELEERLKKRKMAIISDSTQLPMNLKKNNDN